MHACMCASHVPSQDYVAFKQRLLTVWEPRTRSTASSTLGLPSSLSTWITSSASSTDSMCAPGGGATKCAPYVWYGMRPVKMYVCM